MRKVMDKNSYKFSKYGGIIVLDKSMNIIYSYKETEHKLNFTVSSDDKKCDMTRFDCEYGTTQQTTSYDASERKKTGNNSRRNDPFMESVTDILCDHLKIDDNKRNNVRNDLTLLINKYKS